MRALILATLLTLAPAAGARAQTPDEAWADWAAVLSRYVADEHVQYGRWKAENPPEWRRFLAWLERAEPSRLSAEDQRAFWINAHNARTVAGILERYPLDSVRDVGFLRGRVRGFFRRREHPVAGRSRSLEEMRALATRPPEGDPRAHFALTLGTESSPPIRPEPYRGATLDTQLDFQIRTFLNGPHGSRLDEERRVLRLTPILSWYDDDFAPGGASPRGFAARYLVGPAAEAAGDEAWGVEWLPFDWRLNEVRRP
jgi:hypothetical protein